MACVKYLLPFPRENATAPGNKASKKNEAEKKKQADKELGQEQEINNSSSDVKLASRNYGQLISNVFH